MDRFGDDFQTVSEILGTKTPDMVKGIIAFHSKIYYNKSKFRPLCSTQGFNPGSKEVIR